MNLDDRINAFVKLGEYFNTNTFSDELFIQVENNNPWFVKDNINFSLNQISSILTKDNLYNWLSKYPKLKKEKQAKTIAVVTAGNIPLVGFHDFLSVLITGNNILIKLSSKDNLLLKEVAKLLIKIEPKFKNSINFTENIMKGFDAIITTGSDNSAKHFQYYFDKYPHIIRKNRNSIAIITGEETKQELENLADDVFMYFGLGCRNVSKIFIPENYDLKNLFEAFTKYEDIIQHNKYANNYDYNRSIYLMNNIKFFEDRHIILKEDINYSSPISVVYYERYKDIEFILSKLKADTDKIQVIIANISEKFIKFGKAQKPDLNDYADNIDTIKFLSGL